VLTGGGALVRKIDKHLAKETGLRVILAENPLDTVVMGTGHLLSNRELLDRVAVA
jgi:rod shape-determining protein MreB